MTRARELADLLTGGQTITTDDNTAQLTVKSTDADANSGPLLVLTRDSGSPADGDNAGLIQFKFDNDAGDDFVSAAQISAKANDVSDGSEDGELEILTIVGGSSRSRVEMFPSETVLNEDSQDIDFRVEGNGNANMLFVDAGNDKVGVGTNTPAAIFSALSTSGTTTDIGRFEAAVGSYTGTSLVAGNTLGAASSYNLFSCITDSDADAGGPVTQFIVRGDGNVGIGTSSPTQPLSISANGANGLFLLRDEGDAADSCRLFFDSSNTRYALFAKDGVLSVRSGGTPGSSSGTERVQFTVNGINSSAVAANTTASSANLFISGGNNFQKSTSSRRYKTEITNATHGLADVLNLRSVTYKGVNDGETVFGGLIAEEVHDAGLTHFVNYEEDDEGNLIPDGLHYGHMVALAFKAIQELKTELDAEKAKTATLQTQVADLITRVTALEAE